MQAWVRTKSGGYRCTRKGHGDEEFQRGESCKFCNVSRVPVEEENPEDDPEDQSLRADAQEYRCRARFLYRKGKESIAKGGREVGAGAKLICESTKLERLANDIFEQLAQRAHDKRLIAHDRIMAGLRKLN